jgi:hypothetical protein
MNERPAWRYIYLAGWNVLALAWILVGAVSGLFTEFVVCPLLRGRQLRTAAIAIGVGLAVLTADLTCRWRDRVERGPSRLVSGEAGGTAFFFVPAWVIAIGIIATGVAFALGVA